MSHKHNDYFFRKGKSNLMSRINGQVPIIGQKQEFQPRYMIVDTPAAQPSTFVLPSSDGPVQVVFGGLTKLEAVAAQIAAGAATTGAVDHAAIVDAAQALLAECRRRERPEQEEVPQ